MRLGRLWENMVRRSSSVGEIIYTLSAGSVVKNVNMDSNPRRFSTTDILGIVWLC
jgi:hypothetical protein